MTTAEAAKIVVTALQRGADADRARELYHVVAMAVANPTGLQTAVEQEAKRLGVKLPPA